MRTLCLFIILWFSFEGCQTIDFPEPSASTKPQFFAEGLLNGQPWSIVAGQNNYFMDGYFEKDNQNVYLFKAYLRPQNCTANCPNSLSLYLRDHQPVNGLPAINTSLAPGKRQVSSEIKDSIRFLIRQNIECRKTGDSTTTSVFWMLNDKTYRELPGLTFEANEKNTLAMIIKHSNGITITLSQKLSVESNGRIQIRIVGSTNGYKLTITSLDEQKNPIKTIAWSNGKMTPEVEFERLPAVIKSQIVLANGNQLQLMIETPSNVAFNGALCAIDYVCEAVPVKSQATQPLSTAEINFYNGQGKLFSSKFAPANGQFTIEGVEDFTTNAAGFKTKKVTTVFSTTLFDATKTQSVKMENIKFVCAVAYPN